MRIVDGVTNPSAIAIDSTRDVWYMYDGSLFKFNWGNGARGSAVAMCVVLGFANPPRFFGQAPLLRREDLCTPKL